MVGSLREGKLGSKTAAEDGLAGPLGAQRQQDAILSMIEDFTVNRYGASPVESRQAGQAPGLSPREGPPLATGGRFSQTCGVGRRRRRTTTTGQNLKSKFLNILHWNAEGTYNKKLPLTERLYSEDIDVACLQETHLNPNLRFQIRGYQCFRLDREGRHKGGVLILVKNNIPASDLTIDTNNEAEIQGVKIHTTDRELTIYNIYCPPDKELSLHALNITAENCIVVGDFNSHSTNWGYDSTDKRGEDVEDWQIETQLLLLNDSEDPPTFYSRRWMSTSSPDLAFATDNIAKIATRKVLKQLGGSDHRPIKISLDFNHKLIHAKTFPRWNYKRANWTKFSMLTDQYTKGINENDKNINRVTKCFNKAILNAAKESIPRGARKNYKPYWTEELQKLEDDVSAARERVEEFPCNENNISYKACEAKYKRTYKQAAKNSWKEKTESLNLEKDGKKLWKLTKAMNNEPTRYAPITIMKENNMLTRKEAANCLIDHYSEVSNSTIPDERKRYVLEEMKNNQLNQEAEVSMTDPLSLSELLHEMKNLKHCKSPGPDKLTNEMLQHLGSQATKKLLGIYNNSWTSGNIPQCWREAHMIPIHKKGKDKGKASSYRPISLTSCVGKLMERLINARLTWYLEKSKILVAEQSGFRSNRSTEDQVTYISQKIEDGFQEKKKTVTIWIDMAKAFDTVWKDGLRLKLKQIGIHSKMMKWLGQYLNNRKGRVFVDGSYSRKKVLKQGVPQGGVLSPTLFLVFINDIIKQLPRNVFGAIYADDLAIWCTEEYTTTATYRLQEALNILETWTKKWLININETKTTYTIFSLSPKESKTTLRINGQLLPLEINPTYLGVTFDKRLTWKPQIEKLEAQAKKRLNLMKKLASTTWGADARVLRTMYTGRVRPVLEYGIPAWGTASQSNFNKLKKVQNQASRIITGGMKSTPIKDLESATGLQSLEDRHETKVMMQAAKFKRLPEHPMHHRMNQLTKGRLKRESFVQKSKSLERNYHLNTLKPQNLTSHSRTPIWQVQRPLQVQLQVPEVGRKDSHSDAEKRYYTIKHLDAVYPDELWTRVYTDGSAENAVRNGGAGIYISYPNGKEENLSVPTGQHSSNYKAEAIALIHAVSHVTLSSDLSNNIVLLTDALSVLQAIQSRNDRELDDLVSSLHSLNKSKNIILQWIPSHCNIKGNEIADSLAKEGAKMPQENEPTSYKENKQMIKFAINDKWSQRHPDHKKDDPIYRLSRSEQVIIFRLRTGHTRLKYHLHTKFKIGTTGQCSCETGIMTVDHVLQSCPLYDDVRKKIWPQPTLPNLRPKLWGGLEDLRGTASFIKQCKITI